MSITSLLQHSRRASRQLALRSPQEIDDMLLRVAASIERNASALLEANLSDMSRMEPADPRADRLLLTEQRIADIVRDMRAVAALPSPLGRELVGDPSQRDGDTQGVGAVRSYRCNI